ncbi:MAG TPA: ECF-type sigma factor [Gemmatimonadaceae bacterium]|nr:ECF-type sigma factor [Gemmatimonadaceae bacterium]
MLTLLHGQLRLIAHRQLAGEAEGHTLETSGLVSEAFLRLLGVQQVQWHDTQHLLAMASRSMRRVLVDHAEHRNARKRGGGVIAADVDPAELVAPERPDDMLALDEALERLEHLAPRQSRVVECRFFGGLSVEETAVALQLSPATVKREWTAARAWLNRELAT